MTISKHRLQAFYLRHLLPLRRDLDLLTDMFYWPLVDILLWGVTGKWLTEGSESLKLLAAILMGLICWQVIWRACQEVARNLIDEIWNGNLVNLFSTPITLTEWMVGVISLSFFKTLLTLSVITPTIYLLYRFNVLEIGLWLIPFFALCSMFGLAIGFIAASLVIRYGAKLQTVVWTFPAIFLPFSAIFFPVAQLGALRPVAYLVPTSYVTENMRMFLETGQVYWPSLVLSFGLNLVYLFLAMRFFIKSFNYSKQLGLNRFG